MLRQDETWHRLNEWTYGQALSERLAAQILLADGFTDVDPSHPLGGRDGGKDAVARKDGKRWTIAVYFPRGRKAFGRVKAKLIADFAGVAASGAAGLVFVTNQELSLGQRRELEESVSASVLLLHLERLVAILDQPAMHAVREQFLSIPMRVGELMSPPGSAPAFDQLEEELRQALTGEFGFLSTRGLPRDLRSGEPRLPMDGVYVPLRARLLVKAMVVDAFENLSYRERRVLELRFGLGGEQGRTLDEVGSTFAITRVRVSQIERGALRKVTRQLERAGEMAALGLRLDRKTTIDLLKGRHSGMPIVELLCARRLVVLGGPGSGKSTLTRYVVWAVAGRRQELPDAVRGDLPLRVSAAEFARALAVAPTGLYEFLLERSGRFAPVLRRGAEEERLRVIIDGLDEVTDPTLAFEVQEALNRFLADAAYADVSVLITSRIVGFHPVGLLAELPAVTLEPLDGEEMARFLSAWFAQLDVVDAEGTTERMVRRLERDSRMLELAGNPLLLTVLALLQARDRRLPNERAQLYAAATETLMHSWPLEQRGSELSFDTVPGWLAPLARTAFLSSPELGVPEHDVIDILASSWQSKFGGPGGAAREQTRALLNALRDDSGLLNVTGHSSEGVRLWDFLHRSFAEYLVARDLAEDHLHSGYDPVPLAHLEAWREVIMMMLGELGRRRMELVGPLLRRLAAAESTPWEHALRRDLRLALSALARDVPCDERHAEALVDEALTVWSTTAIIPLKEDLVALLACLPETRYANLFARRADLLLSTREQRLQAGLMLAGVERRAMLTSLLQKPDAAADDAAIALLSGSAHEIALSYLRPRLRKLDGLTAVRAAEEVARHDLALAAAELAYLVRSDDAEAVELAARALSRLDGRKALLAMEGLLDLDDEAPLEPVLDRLAQADASTQRRISTLAQRPGAQRFRALSLLHRMDPVQAEPIIAHLEADGDFETRRYAVELRGNEDGRNELAIGALSDPQHPGRVWAARTLVDREEYSAEAIAVLTSAAVDPDDLEQLGALSMLAEIDPQLAVVRLAAFLESVRDRGSRIEAVLLLGDELIDSGGGEVLAQVLGDPDLQVAYRAARALLWAGDDRGLRSIIEATLDGRLDQDDGLHTIIRWAKRTENLRVALGLLRRKKPAARELGARMLAVSPNPHARRHAAKLLDDENATVRCAAVWTLASQAETARAGLSEDSAEEQLLDRVGLLLGDDRRIEGPPLENPHAMFTIADVPRRPAYCCSDVIYQLLERRPTLLEAALRRV